MANQEVDVSRRDLGALLGVLGGAGLAALAGCAKDAAADGPPEALGQVKEALNGSTNIQWVDSVQSLRALDGSCGVGCAYYVAILENYYPAANGGPPDGGGGIFVWSTVSAADDSGTILNSGGYGTSSAGWRRVYSGGLSVRWFGAKGDSTTDDSGAIAAAVTASANQITGSFGASASRPAVFFPPGRYYVGSGPIGLQNSLLIRGDRAVLHTGSGGAVETGKTIFNNIQNGTSIEGLGFYSGKYALIISTADNDTTHINVTDCEFSEQNQACISDDGNSASTVVNIRNCKFIQMASTTSTSCQALFFPSLNGVVVDGCWFSNKGTYPIEVDNGYLLIDGCVLTPQPGISAWIKTTTSAMVTARGCRFGGETDVAVYECNGSASNNANYMNGISVRGCFVNGSAPFVLNAVPNVVDISGNMGFVTNPNTTTGFTYGTLTAAQLEALGNFAEIRIDGNSMPISIASASSSQSRVVASRMLAKGTPVLASGGVVSNTEFADVVFNGRFDDNSYTWLVNAPGSNLVTSATNGTYSVFGTTMVNVTATANGAYFQAYIDMVAGAGGSALFPPAAPYVYTLVLEVVCITGPSKLQVRASDTQRFFTVPVGRTMLSIPFVYDGTTVSYSGAPTSYLLWNLYDMKGGDVVAVGPMRVLAGHRSIDTAHTVVHSAGIPTSGKWSQGDVVMNTSPAAGGNLGWICTTKSPNGSSGVGTWKSFGAISS